MFRQKLYDLKGNYGKNKFLKKLIFQDNMNVIVIFVTDIMIFFTYDFSHYSA